MTIPSDTVPQDAMALFREGKSDAEVMRVFKVGRARVQRWRRESGIENPYRHGYRSPEQIEAQKPQLQTEAWPSDVDSFGSTMWTALENYQAELKRAAGEVPDEVSVTLPDKPAMIIFLSDLHIGHVETNMELMRQDFEAIKATPGAYVILGGDLIDNVVTGVASRGMHHETLTRIEIQKYLIEEAVEYLGSDRILAMLLGNHDEWSVISDDFDPIRYLAHKADTHYLGPTGFVNVTVGKEEYRILCSHQFRMSSSFNKTHSAKRLMDFWGDADVVFIGHHHDAATETAEVRRLDHVFAQAGSYLESSRYSRRKGFTKSKPHMPGVILDNRRHEFEGFKNALSRLWMLEAVRSNGGLL